MKLLLADLKAKQRLYSQYGHCSLPRALLTDGTLAVLLYRLQQGLMRIKLVPLALLAQLVNKWLNGCMIGLRASFGPGFILVHPVGTVINSAVTGGRNVWLQSSVVIGENRGQSPTLGKDIFVGAGARIIGGIHIGDGARIGANAVVMVDVAPGSTMVGIPARPVIRAQ